MPILLEVCEYSLAKEAGAKRTICSDHTGSKFMEEHSKTAAENRKILALLLMVLGVIVLIGPIGTLLWLGHSGNASEGAIMFWHLFSSFGIVIYGPIALALIALGLVIWFKTPKT